jgi:hypothetical protein
MARHPEGPWEQAVFDQRQHLKFAWSVLCELPVETAKTVVTDEIRSFADVNAPGRYHETLTRFWVKLVAHTRSTEDGGSDFSAHLARYPVLLNKQAPENHYSRALLGSPGARIAFAELDLRPMP